MTEGTLTKVALVEQVANVAELTKKRAEVIVETVFGSIAQTLHREEKVELRGFGSFRFRRREPRRARNPKTCDRVDVASKHVAYFTPDKELINQDPA
ncbi:MAG: HU family DNA-binding protein [Chloroflexota bacterium]|nr:HU family DNA-binding protein [Chloroflexota bacterium]